MSQHDLTINNQGFPAFRADLNDALQALGSTQSGTTAPSPTFANQLWYDTTNNILKFRNEDNDAWISLLTLNQTADTVSSLSLSSLTSGRVTYAGASGVLQDDADFTFNGTTVTLANDAVISGLDIGKGGGSVSTNTRVGAGTLSSNTSGLSNVAIGYLAFNANTTGQGGVAIGSGALQNNTTGNNNAGVGINSLLTNTTGQYNSAYGTASLQSNTTGANNVAVGYTALLSNTTASNNTAVGYQALYANTTGTSNTSVGYQSLDSCTTGTGNTALGFGTGVALTTGGGNTIVGREAGEALTTANNCTFVGTYCGEQTTGASNTFVGGDAGYLVTSGASNTILGRYNGNQGSLDIRTASNYIVLSDGDGNPRFQINSVGKLTAPPVTSYTSSTRVANTVLSMGSNGSGADVNIAMTDAAAYNYYFGGYNGTAYVTTNNSGGVKLALGATSWAADSDERFKNIKEPITNALNNLATLRTVYGNYKNDADDINRLFLIAQDVQKVYPEAVDVGNDEDKTLSLRAVDLIPVLVKAIQELKAEVDSLKAQLNK
jgi:hypothetical protein